MIEKDFKTNLILNWRNGKFRSIKDMRKAKITPFEIPIEINIKVKCPEEPRKIIARGEVELDTRKIAEMTFEYLSGNE